MKHCLYFEPTLGGTGIQLLYLMCRPLSHAENAYLQAGQIRGRKLWSQPPALSPASSPLPPAHCAGPISLALHLSSQQRLHWHKCRPGQGMAPLKHTSTSHRLQRKLASGLENQWQALKRSSGGGSSWRQNQWLHEAHQITAAEGSVPRLGHKRPQRPITET